MPFRRRDEQPHIHSVTSAAGASHDDQDQRLHRYLTMMVIRIVCFGLAVWTVYGLHWVWGWFFVPGAVVLPYIAVIGANAHAPREPGSITPVDPDTPGQLPPSATDR